MSFSQCWVAARKLSKPTYTCKNTTTNIKMNQFPLTWELRPFSYLTYNRNADSEGKVGCEARFLQERFSLFSWNISNRKNLKDWPFFSPSIQTMRYANESGREWNYVSPCCMKHFGVSWSTLQESSQAISWKPKRRTNSFHKIWKQNYSRTGFLKFTTFTFLIENNW
jgi:hypothetical protein